MDFRFAIGCSDGPQASQWKLWNKGEDLYLLVRSHGNVNKFSFHKSRICRWATNQPRPDGSDRAFVKWTRITVPEAGEEKAALLLTLITPTNHLGALQKATKAIHWIDPAPPGQATVLEFLLTRDNKGSVEQSFARLGLRKVVYHQRMHDDLYACIVATNFDCGPVTLHAPGKPVVPGQIFGDLDFPDVDSAGSGRPIRMFWPAPKHDPPVIWELGGYKVTDGQFQIDCPGPHVTMTRLRTVASAPSPFLLDPGQVANSTP